MQQKYNKILTPRKIISILVFALDELFSLSFSHYFLLIYIIILSMSAWKDDFLSVAHQGF